jgi:hypothetical protein
MKKLFSASALIVVLTACTSGLSGNDQVGSVATGMLKTRNYIITMYATQNNQLFSVKTLDGTILQEDVSIETMVALYPELEYLQGNDNISWAGLDGIATPGARTLD